MASGGRGDKLEELDLSREEVERLGQAFRDEHFRQLFREYAEEISDPENRRLYEQEIRALEQQRGVDARFVHPQPGHALRTSVGGRQRCYVNVCSNELMGKPECKPGPGGQHWSLPYSLSPGREDLSPGSTDKHVIFDVVFHPDTLRLAASNPRFRAMLDATALEGVEKQFGVTLDKRNVKTLKLKYKGLPQATVLRSPLPGGTELQEADPDDPLQFPNPYEKAPAGSGDGLEAPKAQEKPELNPDAPTVPHYTITHRAYVDLQDYRHSRDAAPSTVPKELLVTIHLPLLKCASDATLDIHERQLSLDSEDPAYKLLVTLPYPVDDNLGTAKFNKAKRQLLVTLPVVAQKCQALADLHQVAATGDVVVEPERQLVEELNSSMACEASVGEDGVGEDSIHLGERISGQISETEQQDLRNHSEALQEGQKSSSCTDLTVELEKDPSVVELPEDDLLDGVPLVVQLPDGVPVVVELLQDRAVDDLRDGGQSGIAFLREVPLTVELPEGVPLVVELLEDETLDAKLSEEASPFVEQPEEGQSVELSDEDPSVAELSDEGPSVVELLEEVPLIVELPEGVPWVVELPEDEMSDGKQSEEGLSVVELSEDILSLVELSKEGLSIVELSEGELSVVELSETGLSVVELSEEGPSVVELPVEVPLVIELSDEGPSVVELSEDTFIVQLSEVGLSVVELSDNPSAVEHSETVPSIVLEAGPSLVETSILAVDEFVHVVNGQNESKEKTFNLAISCNNNSSNCLLVNPQLNEQSSKTCTFVQLNKQVPSAIETANRCPKFQCTQDTTSVTLIILVPCIDKERLKDELSTYQYTIQFYAEEAQTLHTFVLCFNLGYKLNTDEFTVCVSKHNAVIQLTKASESRGMWEKFSFGVNEDNMQERLFVTEDNVDGFLDCLQNPQSMDCSVLERGQPVVEVLGVTDESSHFRVKEPVTEASDPPGSTEQSVNNTDNDSSQNTVRYHSQNCKTAAQRPHLIANDKPSISETNGEKMTSLGGGSGLSLKSRPVESSFPLSLENETKTLELRADATTSKPATLCHGEKQRLLRTKGKAERLETEELDEDDVPSGLPDIDKDTMMHNATPPVIQEINPEDGSVHVISDHTTRCAFSFQNPLIYDLD